MRAMQIRQVVGGKRTMRKEDRAVDRQKRKNEKGRETKNRQIRIGRGIQGLTGCAQNIAKRGGSEQPSKGKQNEKF